MTPAEKKHEMKPEYLIWRLSLERRNQIISHDIPFPFLLLGPLFFSICPVFRALFFTIIFTFSASLRAVSPCARQQ